MSGVLALNGQFACEWIAWQRGRVALRAPARAMFMVKEKVMLNRALLALSVAVVWASCVPAAPAAGGGDDGSTATSRAASEDPDYVAGKQAVAAMNWQAALDAFNKAAARDPTNANAQNYLGYTYRHLGKFDLAFKHYEEALRLNPKHRGAHEYLGEAYLEVNNLAKAEEQLKALDRLCYFGCEEYDDLKKAVAEYKQKSANKQ